MKKSLTRTEARENVFLLLFQASYNVGSDIENTLDLSKENLDIHSNKYVERVYSGIIERVEELDSYIEKASKNWNKNRISRVAVSCIRLALYEMLYEENMTPGIAISQAVGLAKKYGDADTASFVNGILGGICRSNPDKFPSKTAPSKEAEPAAVTESNE